MANNIVKIDLSKLIDTSINIADKNKDIFQNVKKLEKYHSEIDNRIFNLTYTLSYFTPSTLTNFKMGTKSASELSNSLIQRIDSINKQVDLLSNITKEINLALSQTQMDTIDLVDRLENIINLYKSGDISQSKETMRKITNIKDQLENDYQIFYKLSNTYTSFENKIKNYSIPEYTKTLLTPEFISLKRRGLYLPGKIRKYVLLKMKFSLVNSLNQLKNSIDNFENKSVLLKNKWENYSHNDINTIKADMDNLTKMYSEIKDQINKKAKDVIETFEDVSKFNIELFNDHTSSCCFIRRTGGLEDQFDKLLDETSSLRVRLASKSKVFATLIKRTDKSYNKTHQHATTIIDKLSKSNLAISKSNANRVPQFGV